MAKSQSKITLSASRDIPFNKLVLSQANVRRIKAGVSIEELADDIARRTLLQSLTVRPVLDEEGAETGMFEVPAGGRRYRALELLIKKRRLNRTAPVPCVVRTEGLAEEDSLAENVQRAPLHPLDQFRAFVALKETGQSEEEISAAFFVSIAVVKQRLKLAAVSPKLLDIYAEDGMTLDQLMAFTVNPDHARQEQVWEAIAHAWSREPHHIRRMLTENAIRASDKRAQFIGIEAYEAAGGAILRDLFQSDDGGWLQDPALVDRLATEKLEQEAEAVRAEGWRWVEIATDFPYGHTYGLGRLTGEPTAPTEEEKAAYEALRAEYEDLESSYDEADELPEEVDQRLGELETALEAFENRPMSYEPEYMARAGAFVSIDGSGHLRVERGYVRPEDDVSTVDEDASEEDTETGESQVNGVAPAVGGRSNGASEPEDDDRVRPLPDRLLTELTAHRTLALRDAVANDPQVAFMAALHVLCLKLFYRDGHGSCLEIEPKSSGFSAQAPGLADTVSAKAIAARHEAWAKSLPTEPEELWDALKAFDQDHRQMLFAHCVALTVNAVHDSYHRRPKAIAHADCMAESVKLDMAAADWQPAVETYLGRVTKARILEAVREAKGEAAAQLIDHLKKPEMASEAEPLLAGTGWLPEPLRTPGQSVTLADDADGSDVPLDSEGQSAMNGGESAMDDGHVHADTDGELAPAHSIAAE